MRNLLHVSGNTNIHKKFMQEENTVCLINAMAFKTLYPEKDFIFTLAFDRMLSLEVTNEKFEYDIDCNPAEWFKDCYGIMNDFSVPMEKIVIRAFGREANYMRDLPLHHSQQEVEIMEEYSDFELFLRPTADFIAPLLARGSAIKVLYPQWLADAVKQQHQEAANLYE